MGERRLRKCLAKFGNDEKDLAGVLRKKNWTAIAEVVRYVCVLP
jgi:tRNA splicing ligase